MSRDYMDIQDMLNGWVEIILIYKRCIMDESRWYGYIRYVKRISRDGIYIHDMLDGWVDMVLIYMRY